MFFTSVCLLFFSVLISSNAVAQPLFTYVDIASAGLTGPQLEIIDSIENNPDVDTVTIVDIANIWNIQTDGYFTVNVFGHPDRTVDIFNIDMPTTSPLPDDYYIEGWQIGEFQNEAGDYYTDYDGDIQLIKYNDEIIGSIRPFNSNELYNIISLGNGKNAIVKFNSITTAGTNCTPLPVTTPAAKITGPCNREIRILVLSSPRAKHYSNNPYLQAVAFNWLLQGGVYNSMQHNTQGLNFVLAGYRELTTSEFPETGNSVADVSFLTNNPMVNALRDQYEADIVVCLTGRLSANNKTVWGESKSIGPDNSSAYAVVSLAAPMNKYTFAHEVGHLMGARHQQWQVRMVGDWDNNGSSEHGYSIERNLVYKSVYHSSIMHTDWDITEHYFSTPNIKIRKKPFGKSQYNDVTSWLYNYGCTVADFRTGPPPTFYANISAPFVAYTGTTVNLTGTPYYGVPNYDFEWEISTDGGLTYNNIHNDNGVSISNTSFSMPAVPKVYVRMKSTDYMGINDSKIRVIHNYGVSTTTQNTCCPGHYDPIPLKPLMTSNLIKGETLLEVSPNPANSFTDIFLNLPENQEKSDGQIMIYDITGKEIKKINIKGGVSTIRYNTSDLPSGNYTIKLVYNTTVLNKKLVIIK